jgi:exopolysaccharide biosynthesis polyprenyl glycosylphosphotransferase
MPSAPEGAIRIPIHSEHSDASSSKKRTTRPQYRYAIRAIAILVAFIGDIILIGVAALTAAYLRFESLSASTPYDYLLVIIPTYLLAAVALDCYGLNTLRQSMRSISRALLALGISAGFAVTTAFALQVGVFYSRVAAGLMLVLASVFLTCGRLLYKVILDHLPSVIDPHVLILGPALGAMNLAANVESSIPSERPYIADPDSLERAYAQVKHADRIILAFDDVDDQVAWAQFVRLIGVDVELIKLELQNITILGINHWEGTPTLVVARGALTFGERALKRAFDLTISVALLVLVGPCLLLLMLLVKLNSSGPAIFAQPRIGRNNCRYQCYKLRTMREDMSDPSGTRSTARDDNRITSIGKFLRRTSIDELPQLWNVIRGDMSLVGPRPHPLGTLAEGQLLWDAVPEYWARHAMRPGITGLAQVRGLRGATDRRSAIEKRVEADLEYINSWSIWLDLKILLQTIRVVMHPNAF